MASQHKGVIILRWLGFVPGAIAAAWLTWWLVQFSSRLSIWMVSWVIDISPDDFMSKLTIEVVSGGAMGAAFVYIGSHISPASRKTVAYVLAVVAVFIAGGASFPVMAQQQWWAVGGVIAMAGGAACVAYQVAEGEL